MKVDMGLIEDLANVLQFSFHKDYGGALSAKQIEAAEAAIKRRLVEEIEACAKIADDLLQAGRAHRNVGRDEETALLSCAAAIRARAKTEG